MEEQQIISGSYMIYTVSTILITSIVSWIGNNISTKNKIKVIVASQEKDKTDIKRRDELYKQEVKDFSNSLTELIQDFRELKEHITFSPDLENTIHRIATNHIEYNSSLDEKYRPLIVSIDNQIASFAKKFYSTDSRNNETELTSLLRNDILERITTIQNRMLHIVEPVRCFKYANGKQIEFNFVQFIWETDLDLIKSQLGIIIEKLVFKLEKNGLKNNEIKDTFTKFFNSFLKTLTKRISDWNEMELYEHKETM